MDYVIFGNSKSPDLSFYIDPTEGTLNISSKSNYVMWGGGQEAHHNPTIDWWWMIMNTTPDVAPSRSYPDWEKARSELQESLLPLTATKGERLFLDAYLKKSSEKYPALIPQTWVNWLHYSRQDPERAKRTKSEPLRVDFTLYWQNRNIIIEIDGSSHFSDIIDVDDSGRIRYEPSMGKYTEHLKKDRWLRARGWEVWRFSETEILEKDFDLSAVLREMAVLIR